MVNKWPVFCEGILVLCVLLIATPVWPFTGVLVNGNAINLVSDNTDNTITYARSIGGPGAEYFVRMLPTNEGVVMAGTTIKSVSDTTDLLLSKISPDGIITSAMLYGGTHKDVMNNIIKTSDGGFLLLGETQSLFFTLLKFMNPSTPIGRPIVIKVKPDLSLEWAQLFPESYNYFFQDAVELENEYFITGYDPKVRGIIVSMDKSGKLKAGKVISEGYVLYSSKSDNNSFMTVGVTKIDSSNALTVIKVSNNGEDRTIKCFASKDIRYNPTRVLSTQDKGCIVNGSITEIDDKKNEITKAFVAKFNSNVEIEWIRSYATSKKTTALSVIEYASGYIIDGYATGFRGDIPTGLHILVDNKGNGVKYKIYGSTTNTVTIDKSYLDSSNNLTSVGLVAKEAAPADFLLLKNNIANMIVFDKSLITVNEIQTIETKVPINSIEAITKISAVSITNDISVKKVSFKNE
ncbi:MAG: hypothetical protein WC955_08365 [Elusimicrobiota bacterium]